MALQAEQRERFRRGWERLIEVDAEGGERVVESLKDVAPDLGRYVVEFAYGDGSVRGIAVSAPGSTLAILAGRNDGQPVPVY